MVAIPYGRGAYKRERGGLPPFTLINMFVEATPSAENGVVLMSRPGLRVYNTVGSGPVDGLFTQPGIFNGDIFSISGGNLHRNDTFLGTIVGTGPASFAASGTEILVTRGGGLYSYNGVNLVAVVLPDNFSARAVTFISGHFIAIRDGSHKWYWSGQLNGRTWDALDFASAESEPDNLLDCVAMRGNLYLLGQATIEPWFYTGDLNLPFSLIQQRLFPKGVHSTGCAVEMDNALFFVGSDGIVYRTADVPERLSDHGIEEQVEVSGTVAAFGFIYEGHNFFCVRLDAQTLAYDAATGQWCELRTEGRPNFSGRSAVVRDRIVLFGDDSTGRQWTFADDYADNGGVMLREFTAAFPLNGGTAIVDSLIVTANSGRTDLLAGQGSDPVIEMATSRDAGATFGEFRPGSLGKQGEYRTLSKWTRVGQFDSPGAMFRLRVTDNVALRVTNVLVNEPGGGRGR